MSNPENNPENISFRALAARYLIKQAVERFRNSIPPGANIPLPPDGALPVKYSHGSTFLKSPVCIIGAGMAGLYAAMHLDKMGIDYEIFEASDRPGGRVYTHHFPETSEKKTYDYYDVGAMRFPRIKIMDRTFALFRELGLERDGKLIPYIMSADNNITLINDQRVISSPVTPTSDDPYHFSVKNGGNVPDPYLKETYVKADGTILKGVDALIGKALEPFKDKLVENFEKGWKHLMEYDAFSMRAYLIQQMKYPFSVVQWMETIGSSTGAYDLALSETVMDSLDFDYPEGPNNLPADVETWTCIDGGTSLVTERMLTAISKDVTYNRHVTAIRMENNKIANPRMFVKFNGKDEFDPKPYCHVIATPALSCMRSVDLTEAGLDFTQKQALRCLAYGAAIKVGIKFKTRWWQSIPGYEQIGGVSNTDRPIRVVVYPSYGVHDAGAAGVLIASYAWTQDASRLGAFIKGKGTSAEENLLDMVYNDLAAMHREIPGWNKDAAWYRNETVDHFAFDWYHDQYAVGGYAQFGAGQFNGLYPEMTKPAAKGSLHFAGEATSTHHAWIVGALDSAWRAVYHILLKEGAHELIKKFVEDKKMIPEEIKIGHQEAWQVLRGIHGNLDM